MTREGLARSGVISLLGSAFAALAALLLTAVVGNTLGASGTGLGAAGACAWSILEARLTRWRRERADLRGFAAAGPSSSSTARSSSMRFLASDALW